MDRPLSQFHSLLQVILFYSIALSLSLSLYIYIYIYYYNYYLFLTQLIFCFLGAGSVLKVILLFLMPLSELKNLLRGTLFWHYFFLLFMYLFHFIYLLFNDVSFFFKIDMVMYWRTLRKIRKAMVALLIAL
jgi:hypothetical protein